MDRDITDDRVFYISYHQNKIQYIDMRVDGRTQLSLR